MKSLQSAMSACRASAAEQLWDLKMALQFFALRVENVAWELEGWTAEPYDEWLLFDVRYIASQLKDLVYMCRRPVGETATLDETLEDAESCAEFFGRRLRALDEQLRKASGWSAFLVVPAPSDALRKQAEELSGIRRWWSAVRSGERKLSDGPPRAH